MWSSFREEETASCGVLASLFGNKKAADPMGGLQLKVLFQKPETASSKDVGKASILQGWRDSKMRCASTLYLKQIVHWCNGRPPARSAFPGAWDTKFAEYGKCEPPSGKNRQQAAVCFPASIANKKVADPTGDLLLCSWTQISSESAVKIAFPLQF